MFLRIASPDNVQPLPYASYQRVALVLCISGLVVSAFLSYSHYLNYTDLGYQSFCAISESINCDTVSQSTYSVVGGLPVPVWGVIGYVLALLVMLPCCSAAPREPARMWALLFWLALGFTGISLAFAAITIFLIRSYCILCIATYVVNFFMLWYAWLIRRRFSRSDLLQDTCADLDFVRKHKRIAFLIGGAWITAVAAAVLFMPAYWEIDTPELPFNVPTGMTAEGYPWTGASHPEIEIEIFSDYQCFQCKKMHRFLRRLVAQHSDSIRLIHRQFPMDHEVNPIVGEPFHRGSGKMALLAIYAAKENRFSRMDDLLFKIAGGQKTINLRWLADKAGLDAKGLARSLSDPTGKHTLSQEIRKGIEQGIRGTPSFLIRGRIYPGVIPAEILSRYLK
jgi:uncharacterized membrane protein/predicted DsbA family dithiol-disulfide isomerase